MSKIFVTGDIHSDPISRFSFRNFPEGRNLNENDIVFVVGDFGVFFVRDEEGMEDERRLLKYLAEKPYTIAFIGGNHENWDYLDSLTPHYHDLFGGEVCQVSKNVFFIPNGTMLNVDGRKIFCMGGAMSTDKNWRLEHERKHKEKIWWENEVPTNEQMTRGVDLLEEADWNVDIVLTHTMPSDCIENFVFLERSHHERVVDPTSRYLNFIMEGLKYSKWYCGHFHKNQRYCDQSTGEKFVQVLYDYIVNPDDEPLKHYGRVNLDPLW